MTFNHKEASEKIARIYGVEDAIYDGQLNDVFKHYITQDIGALMELAIRNGIDVEQFEGLVDFVRATFKDEFTEKHTEFEYYKNHNNDPIEATRVAIAKALIKKGGD